MVQSDNMSDKLILPRTYLSWSAMSIWQTNKERFRREYYENGKKLDTKYLRFGKGIAKMIEDGSHVELLPDLPVYPVREYEIRTEIHGVPILSFLDGDNPDGNYFGEYKTGKHPWDQVKVQKHDQLVFYAAAKKSKTGIIPDYCLLHWIETKDDNGDPSDFWRLVDNEISVTGRVETFRRDFDEREIHRIEQTILQTANEISEDYKLWIAQL